jgi:hypothetical protein
MEPPRGGRLRKGFDMKLDKWICAGVLAVAAAQAHAVGNFADVSVYDRSEGRRLQVYWHEGRAWIVGKPGNEYQIAVRNRRGEDLLAVMSVDGINVISGETADLRQGGYVLSPGHALDVKGWRKSLERTAAFYFTELPDSYAARTGRPEHVGVIGVALFQRKRFEPPPQDIAPLSRRAEPRAFDSAGAASAPQQSQAEGPAYREDRDAKLGTGHGRSESSRARYVSFERASSTPADTVTIYYDSYRNLVARGVIRGPQPYEPGPAPRPFPGFAPDPQG